MAWHFNGTNGYATIGDHAALTLKDAGWSVFGWVRINNNYNGRGYLVAWTTGAGPMFMWSLRGNQFPTGPGKMNFDVRDNDGSAAGMFPSATWGSWTDWRHLGATCTAGGLITLYRDGASIGTTTQAALNDIDVARYWLIGAQYSFTPDLFWRGDMAEWAKWDRVLSASEIAALVTGQTPDWFPQGLGWYCPMRDKPVELVHAVPVATVGITPIEHPRHFHPSPTGWAARAQGVAP